MLVSQHWECTLLDSVWAASVTSAGSSSRVKLLSKWGSSELVSTSTLCEVSDITSKVKSSSRAEINSVVTRLTISDCEWAACCVVVVDDVVVVVMIASQCTPSKPSLHEHTNKFKASVQEPFTHGLDAHSLISENIEESTQSQMPSQSDRWNKGQWTFWGSVAWRQ